MQLVDGWLRGALVEEIDESDGDRRLNHLPEGVHLVQDDPDAVRGSCGRGAWVFDVLMRGFVPHERLAQEGPGNHAGADARRERRRGEPERLEALRGGRV